MITVPLLDEAHRALFATLSPNYEIDHEAYGRAAAVVVATVEPMIRHSIMMGATVRAADLYAESQTLAFVLRGNEDAAKRFIQRMDRDKAERLAVGLDKLREMVKERISTASTQ